MKTIIPKDLMPYCNFLHHYNKKLLGSPDYLPHLMIQYLELHNYCFFCGVWLNYDLATIEHLIPKSHDPLRFNKPKVLACSPCNFNRKNRDLAEFLLDPRRRMVDSTKAGFHFYKYFPQNNFSYLGRQVPNRVKAIILRDGRGYGLLN